MSDTLRRKLADHLVRWGYRVAPNGSSWQLPDRGLMTQYRTKAGTKWIVTRF